MKMERMDKPDNLNKENENNGQKMVERMKKKRQGIRERRQ